MTRRTSVVRWANQQVKSGRSVRLTQLPDGTVIADVLTGGDLEEPMDAQLAKEERDVERALDGAFAKRVQAH